MAYLPEGQERIKTSFMQLVLLGNIVLPYSCAAVFLDEKSTWLLTILYIFMDMSFLSLRLCPPHSARPSRSWLRHSLPSLTLDRTIKRLPHLNSITITSLFAIQQISGFLVSTTFETYFGRPAFFVCLPSGYVEFGLSTYSSSIASQIRIQLRAVLRQLFLGLIESILCLFCSSSHTFYGCTVWQLISFLMELAVLSCSIR